MNYNFDVNDAVKYGLDEAIMLSNLKYWLRKNLANEKNIHDGNVWTYNSMRAFSELFPFWSEMQIKRIIKSLRNQGVITAGNYNKSPYDRTLWYALVDISLLELSIGSFNPMGQTKQHNQPVQTTQPIPDNKPDKENTITDFDLFWSDYPCKLNKQPALKAWRKLPLTERENAHTKLEAFVNSLPDFQKPLRLHASTYLNNKRWEDAVEVNDQFLGYR